MKIAILNWRDRFHPDSGGAEVFVHEIGRRWAEAGNDVTLLSSRFKNAAESSADGGLKIIRIGRVRAGSHHLLAPLTAVKAKAEVVLESINTIPYGFPFRAGGTPSVTLVHQMARDVWKSHLPAPLAPLAAMLERAFIRTYKSKHVVAVSESTKADLESAGVRNVSIIPEGGLGPQPSRVKASSPTLVFVGRLAANKRPDHALEAYRLVRARIPQARLWMVGEGRLQPSLLDRLPAGAEILGKLDRDDLLRRMGEAHLLLVTSVREGWGLVVTEANALGTPAVAYDVPGLRDSIKHGQTGILTSPSPEVLAEAATALLTDSIAYERLCRGATQWGAAHSWDRTADVVYSHLKDAVTRRRACFG